MEQQIMMRIKSLMNERNDLYKPVSFGGERCSSLARKGEINRMIVELFKELDDIIYPRIMRGLGR